MAKRMSDHTGTRRPRWTDGIEQVFKWGPKHWHRIRPFGLVWSDFVHSVTTKKNHKQYPEYCLAYDSDNDTFLDRREERCPACRAGLPGRARYFFNVIDMEKEDQKPAKAGPDWSPVYMIELPSSVFEKIQNMKPLNKNKPVDDPKGGAIISIMRDPDKKGTDMYQLTLDEKTVPITDEQKQYMVKQTIDGEVKIFKGDGNEPGGYVYIRQVSSRKDMQDSLVRNGYLAKDGTPIDWKGGETDESEETGSDSDDDNDEEETIAAKAATEEASETMSSKKSKKDEEKKVEKEEEAEEEEKEEEDDEDEDEEKKEEEKVEEKPKESTKPPKSSVSAPDGCPTGFGKFASAHICFQECPVKKECRVETKNRKNKSDED